MMPTPQESPRRKPKQERARESRDRILDAAAHLFAERGIPNVSTNRIADHAGMSIGSLYRYFADKDAIIEVLRTRLMRQLEEGFTTAVLSGLALEPQAAIAASLHGIVEGLTEQQGLLRALTAEATLDGFVFEDLEKRLLLLTRAYLLHMQGPRSDDELDTRAFVMVSVGLATTMRIGLSTPPGLDRARLVDETARMLATWIAAG